jgi:hypothetical protein
MSVSTEVVVVLVEIVGIVACTSTIAWIAATYSGILTWTITACTAELAFWQGQSLQSSMARYMMTKLLYVKPRSLPRGPSKETASHCSLFLPCCVRAYNNTLLTQCHYCMLLRSFPEVFAYVAASCLASALALVAPLPPAPPESVCLSL